MIASDNREVRQCGGAIGQYATAYIKKQSCYADKMDCGFGGYDEDTIITRCASSRSTESLAAATASAAASVVKMMPFRSAAAMRAPGLLKIRS
jgi:hypothetical protein